MKSHFPPLTPPELNQLKESIFYLNLRELKHLAGLLGLPAQGKKGDIISVILAKISHKPLVVFSEMPAVSQSKKMIEPSPDALILCGSYKNDAKTRAFFKKLVGQHFHFTAFGQDWIKRRWMEGNPPTFQEYADFWQAEQERRKKNKREPKKEWAYIHFLQKYGTEHPNASAQEARKAWHDIRIIHRKRVENILKLK
jgi:hypothetical protein